MRETFLRGAWRALTFLLGLLLGLGSLYVLLHALGLVPAFFYSVPSGVPVEERTLAVGMDLSREPWHIGIRWIAGGLVGVLVGIGCVALAAARPRGEGRQVVLRGHDDALGYGGGRLTVSMRGLRALVVREAERVEGVREAAPRLRLRRQGWHVDCDVALAPSASLPQVAQQLKPRLQEALEHHTGLPVERVDISARLGLNDAHRRVR